MIEIIEKKNCCGCGACAQKCPKHCISMIMDNEGFFCPSVNKNLCIECGLCENVCTILNQEAPREPLQCKAIKGKRIDIVKKSSSAGIFYLLSEKVIQNKGIVFGARFNENWDVVHSWTDNIDGIVPFMASKYVQSQIGECYKLAEEFLKKGRMVLFSGTPCQIAGLKHYLRKDYDNLLCVDVICHGVPSPGIWREYLKSVIMEEGHQNTEPSSVYSPLSERDAMKINGVSFRNKELGWRKYSFVILSSNGLDRSGKDSVSTSCQPILKQKHYYNDYMKAFLNNLTIRQSCFDCPTRKGKSGSDILLGDFWAVNRLYPEFYDANGVSMALAYSEKGIKLLESLDDTHSIIINYSDAKGNVNIEFDEKEPQGRKEFFQDFQDNGIMAMKSYCKQLSGNRLKLYAKSILYKLKMQFK